MGRFRWYHLALMLLSLTRPAAAIELKWISGGSDLTFTEARRCTLVVEKSAAESTLPGEWRLLWLADSAGVTFVPDSVLACAIDTARVSTITPPVSPADSAANLTTAEFCAANGLSAGAAYYVLDQPGGSQSRFKVVALDPVDSTTVLVSNEVTLNGGIAGTYPPVVLKASSTHETSLLSVTAIGDGLGTVQTLSVGAVDNLWSVPLAIGPQSNASVTGTAQVYVPLPQAVVQAGSAVGMSGPAEIPADEPGGTQSYSAGSDTIFYRDPNPSVYPKDFAFHYSTVYDPTNPVHPWKGYFHLFYIRNKAGLDSIIAHAWTDSLGKPWSVDTLAFRPSGIGWDKARVWAPSIQQVGNLTYMFYTGVDSLGNQSIGYATTEMIGTTNTTWTRSVRPAYGADSTGWALVSGTRQFRDPFVMRDPVHSGHYLLFNAGRDRRFSQDYYTVGVARNVPGTLARWTDLGFYRATDHDNLAVPGAVESPMVVRDSLTGAWRMFVANAWYDPLGYESTIFLTQNVGDSLTDTRASSWPQRDTLYTYTGNDADVIGWQACEHLQIGQVHFFAAFEGNGIGITRMHWDPAAQKFIFVYPTVVSVPSGPAASVARFYLAGFRPGAATVRFGIESTSAIMPRVDLYDVGGRRVRRLVASRPTQGHLELEWDGRDESGRPVSAGAYFARLYGSNPSQVLRFPILR